MANIPYAGIVIASGSTGQAVTTTAAQLANWTGNAADYSSSCDSDFSVVPSYTTNQILAMAPPTGSGANPPAGKTAATQQFTYQYNLDIEGTTTAGRTLTFQIRKGGTGTVIADQIGTAAFSTTVASRSMSGTIVLTSNDYLQAKASGTLVKDFPDPSAPDAQHPYFTGQGGAPTGLIPIDVMVTSSASDTLTVSNARFTMFRLR